MMKILHCIIDEKFIDGIMEVFDHAGGDVEHHYVYFPEGTNSSRFRYLKRGDRISVADRKQALRFVNTSGCQVMVMHNLSAFPIEQLPLVDRSIIVLWLAWGYDLYMPFKGHRPLIPIKLYQPLTQKTVNHDYFNHLRMMAKRTRWHILNYNKKVEQGVARIDYFSGVIPWEHEMLTHHSFFHAKRVDFTYFDMKPYATHENIDMPTASGSNILLGNSAGETNNHIDVMKRLSSIDLNDKKIIAPLSYAGRKDYVKRVVAAGQHYFGSRFIPLNTFIPLVEYQQLFESCQYAIYAIERQQALSNVWLALWNGLTVFMSKTSPLYQHLNRQGYHLFTVQDDLHLIAENYALTHEQVMHNRAVRLKYNSQEVNMKKVTTLWQLLKDDLERRKGRTTAESNTTDIK